MADDRLGLGAVMGKERDSDGGGDEHLPPLDLGRGRELLEKCVRRLPGDFLLRHFGEEHDELVAAEAGDDRRRSVGQRRCFPEAPEGTVEPGTDVVQDAVAGIVSQSVVDPLETVEVDEEEGELAGSSGSTTLWDTMPATAS